MQGFPGGMFYYHFDGLGSVVALTDTSGTFAEYYEYDVYGQPTIWDMTDVNNPTIVNSSVVGNPYLFTGRRYDDEISLYYYRARYYNPYIGRFMQTDPIGYWAGSNLYTYCWNNPTNWVDPWGLLGWGPTRALVTREVRGALDKALKPGKPGPGKNLKKGDTKRVAQAIAQEMTNKELDKIKKAEDAKKMEKLMEIKDRIEDKLKGGKGDPEAEKEREKGDPGYKPKEGDKEILERIKEALEKKEEEEKKGSK